MHRLTRVLTAVAIALLFAGDALAGVQPTATQRPVPNKDALSFEGVAAVDVMSVLAYEARIPGLQAAVAIEGEMVWSGAVSTRVGSAPPAEASRPFRIASISKTFTGLIAGRLAAEGALDLDAPITRYVPNLPEHYRNVTARQLANHTAGVRHYRGLETRLNRRFDRLTDALSIFQNDPLVHEPGEAYSYSTYGYTLLGVVLERASGKSFEALLHELVTEPLQMKDTDVETAERMVPVGTDAAFSYGLLKRPTRATPTDHSYKIPGGGIASTAPDLVKLGLELARPSPANTKAVALMSQVSQLNGGRAHNYGLGIRIASLRGGGTRLTHSGGQPGCTARLVVDAKPANVGVLMANIDDAPFADGEALFLIALFEAADPRGEANATALEGTWELPWTEGNPITFTLSRDGERWTGAFQIGGSAIDTECVHVCGKRVIAAAFAERLIAIDLQIDGDAAQGHAVYMSHRLVTAQRLENVR